MFRVSFKNAGKLAAACVLACSLVSGCASSTSDWSRAQSLNTRQGYLVFIKDWPSSPEAKLATDALDKIAWEQTKTQNTRKAYEQYVSTNPKGIYLTDAQTWLDENQWSEACTVNDVDKYHQYVKDRPSGKHLNEALLRIEQMETQADSDAWDNALKKNSLDIYADYLDDVSSQKLRGLHKDEAQTRIDELKKTTPVVSDDDIQKITPLVTELLSSVSIDRLIGDFSALPKSSNAIVSIKSNYTADGFVSDSSWADSRIIERAIYRKDDLGNDQTVFIQTVCGKVIFVRLLNGKMRLLNNESCPVISHILTLSKPLKGHDSKTLADFGNIIINTKASTIRLLSLDGTRFRIDTQH